MAVNVSLPELLLPILAFDSDVRCWNAHRWHPDNWITTRYEVVNRIGAPASTKPLVPRARLFRYLVRLTPGGLARLQDDVQEYEWTELAGLPAGDVFGMQLVLWRAIKAPDTGKKPMGYHARACLLLAHKGEVARQHGEHDAMERFTDMLHTVRSVQKEYTRTRRNDRRKIRRQKQRERM